MRLACSWMLAACLALGGCSRANRPAIPSPDGTMTLRTRVERSKADPGAYLCVVLEVRDRDGRLLHAENTRASDVMRWSVAWVSNDRIRLESADIGTYDWVRGPDGRWSRQAAPAPRAPGTAG